LPEPKVSSKNLHQPFSITRGETLVRKAALAWVTVLVLACTASAQTAEGDTYQGFRLGMVLSETFAVGGGNLEKARAACAKPPRIMSKKDRNRLTIACPKIERTLVGQPTEWEFPKNQLRIAFDKGHIVRISDFNGVVHLQETQIQIVGSNSASTATSSATTTSPTPLPPQTPEQTQASAFQEQDVAAASRAAKTKREAAPAPLLCHFGKTLRAFPVAQKWRASAVEGEAE
jgi:hypothetical protein